MSLYDDKSGAFEKYFSILVGISLFVLFFLLFPYVTTQQVEYDISKKIDNVTHSLILHQKQVSVFKNVHDSMVNLQQKADTFPANLSLFIRNIAKSQNTFISPNATLASENVSVQQTSFYNSMFAECTGSKVITENKSRFLECNVNQKIATEANGLNNTLYNDVIGPLSLLDNKSQSIIGVKELKNEFPGVTHVFFDIVYSFRSIWVSIDPKELSPISSVMKNFLGKYHHRIDERLFQLSPLVADLNKTATQLKSELNNLKQDRKDITKRITEFESPIGKLAAGFDDLVLVFPLAVVGGFLVCSSFIIQTFRYRKNYLNSYPNYQTVNQATGQIRNLNTQEKVSTAPLWLDKQSSPERMVGRFLVLLVPLAIFIASLYLINYSWNIPGSTFGYDETYRNVFRILYWGVGLPLFAYIYVRILYEALATD
jgi:hypothetical protein